MARVATKGPRIVYERGKPDSVILKIAEYERLLRKVEDRDDLQTLRGLKKKNLKFRLLEEVAAEL